MLKERFTFCQNLNITNFIMLTIAGMINAFGITIFLSPVVEYPEHLCCLHN